MRLKYLAPLVALVFAAVLAGQAFGTSKATNNKTFVYTVGLWGTSPTATSRRTLVSQILSPT